MNEDLPDGFYFMSTDRDDMPFIGRDLVRVEMGIPRNEAGKAVRQSPYGKPPKPATTEDVCALWPRFAAKELDELRKWKASAIAVEAEWDEQAIARILGAQLGESTRVAIQREVPKLVERVKELERKAEKLKAWGERLEELLPEPPSRNCSCHISPPCSDCMDWQAIREAKAEWSAAKEAKP